MGPVAFSKVGPAAIIFDGDDTLWSTEPLYDRARDDARVEVVRSGLSGDAWDQLERKIDVENVPRFGFSVERFPTSCVQAYEALAHASGITPSPEVRERVRAAASAVFQRDPPLVPGARKLLHTLRGQGVKLALLTKGDRDLQARRVERSGIAELFDLIRIVPEKPPAIFLEIAAELNVSPERAWSVGNSVRSDILPAVESGLRAVWIDAHVWEHERFEGSFSHNQVLAVQDLSLVGDAIGAVLTEEGPNA
jgi:putative hydrolase of the HAD superfamily